MQNFCQVAQNSKLFCQNFAKHNILTKLFWMLWNSRKISRNMKLKISQTNIVLYSSPFTLFSILSSIILWVCVKREEKENVCQQIRTEINMNHDGFPFFRRSLWRMRCLSAPPLKSPWFPDECANFNPSGWFLCILFYPCNN